MLDSFIFALQGKIKQELIEEVEKLLRQIYTNAEDGEIL